MIKNHHNDLELLHRNNYSSNNSPFTVSSRFKNKVSCLRWYHGYRYCNFRSLFWICVRGSNFWFRERFWIDCWVPGETEKRKPVREGRFVKPWRDPRWSLPLRAGKIGAATSIYSFPCGEEKGADTQSGASREALRERRALLNWVRQVFCQAPADSLGQIPWSNSTWY